MIPNEKQHSCIVGGCDFASDPSQSALETAVFWRADVLPTIVVLKAAPTGNAGALILDLAQQWPRASTRMVEDGLHAVHRIHGRRPIRLLIQDRAPSRAPLAAIVPLDDDTPMRLAAVQRLLHTLKSTPHRPERDPLTPIRRTRLVHMLRALDGHLAGATHRAIAETLFRIPEMSAPEWKGHSQRSRTLRLVADAMNLMNGGYLTLLRSGAR